MGVGFVEKEIGDGGGGVSHGGAGDDLDLPSSLIVILDMDRRAWAKSVAAGGPSAPDVTESLLVFIRAFFLLHGGNQVTVIAAHPGGGEILYQSPRAIGGSAPEGAGKKGGVLEMDSFDRTLHSAIVALAKRIASGSGGAGGAGVSMVSSAFAMASCMCNRIVATPLAPCLPRVLAVVAGTDLPSQYIPIMNCIFSFQKHDVVVDALVLAPQDCGLLEQAADITHGVYFRPELPSLQPGALQQWLLTLFLADRSVRFSGPSNDGPAAGEPGDAATLLRLPKAKNVDYRSSCFKTGNPVDVGFVCSVCLSIFATECFVCPTCDTKMARDRPAPGPAKKRKLTKKGVSNPALASSSSLP